MRMLKKLAIPIALVIAAVIFLLVANTPKELRTTLVQNGKIESVLEVSGKISGKDEITVCAGVSGKIISADFHTGDMFNQKDVMIQYDISDLEKNAESAHYNVEYCENGYQAALSESVKNQAKYDEAAALDARYQTQYDEAMEKLNSLDLSQYVQNTEIRDEYDAIQNQILQLNSQIGEKTSELSKLQLKITLATFQQNGWDMQFLTGQAETLQDEIFSLNKQLVALNEAALRLPDQQMENEEYRTYLELSRQISDISRDWSQAKTDKATAEAKILNENSILQLQSSLSMAQVQEKMAMEDLEEAGTGVVADCNGVITQKYVETGAYVTKGTPLYSYQNTEGYKVSVEISQYDMEEVAVGQKAEAAVGSRIYEGSVERIYYVAVTDSSDNAKVKADIELKDAGNMIIGIEADVIIHVGEAENVPILPQSALYFDDGGSYCYVVENGVVEKCYITIGFRGKQGVQVLEGLEEGTHVVIDAITDAKVGEKVHEKIN